METAGRYSTSAVIGMAPSIGQTRASYLQPSCAARGLAAGTIGPNSHHPRPRLLPSHKPPGFHASRFGVMTGQCSAVRATRARAGQRRWQRVGSWRHEDDEPDVYTFCSQAGKYLHNFVPDWKNMVRPRGIEPLTFGFVVLRRSPHGPTVADNPLSLQRIHGIHIVACWGSSAGVPAQFPHSEEGSSIFADRKVR